QGRTRPVASDVAVWGPAWSPSGDELWFSGHQGSAPYDLEAVALSGKRRVIARAPVSLILLDIFHDGRALIARTIVTTEAFALLPGETGEKNISWLDRSQAVSLSSDGKKILYGKLGEGQG